MPPPSTDTRRGGRALIPRKDCDTCHELDGLARFVIAQNGGL